MIQSPDLLIDKIKEGWILLEDVEPTLPGLGDDVEYVPFFVKDNIAGVQFISGDELRKRAVVLDVNYGYHDAKWLYEHQEKLPKRPEGVLFIFFPGTVLQHRNGALLVPYLFWTGEAWDIYFFWLRFGFSAYDRLVRPV